MVMFSILQTKENRMTMQTDDPIVSALLNETVAKFDHKISELAPMVAEHNALRAARDRLVGRPSAQVRPDRPSARVGSTHGTRGRPKGSGGRAAQVKQIITDKPGATTNEIAAEMDIKANYLYRILPSLVADGEIVKDGNGYFAAGISEPVPSPEITDDK